MLPLPHPKHLTSTNPSQRLSIARTPVLTLMPGGIKYHHLRNNALHFKIFSRFYLFIPPPPKKDDPPFYGGIPLEILNFKKKKIKSSPSLGPPPPSRYEKSIFNSSRYLLRYSSSFLRYQPIDQSWQAGRLAGNKRNGKNTPYTYPPFSQK